MSGSRRSHMSTFPRSEFRSERGNWHSLISRVHRQGRREMLRSGSRTTQRRRFGVPSSQSSLSTASKPTRLGRFSSTKCEAPVAHWCPVRSWMAATRGGVRSTGTSRFPTDSSARTSSGCFRACAASGPGRPTRPPPLSLRRIGVDVGMNDSSVSRCPRCPEDRSPTGDLQK